MEIFIRKWSEISGGRFDADFYRQDYRIIDEFFKHQDFKTIKEIVEPIKNGSTPSNGKFEKMGVPYFRSQDLSLYDSIPSLFITESFHNSIARSKVMPNDVLVAVVGATLGVIGFVSKNLLEANINQNIAKLRVIDNEIKAKFLAIFLDSQFGKKQIFRQATITTQAYLNNSQLEAVKIPVLSKEIQQHIIDIMDNAYVEKRRKEGEAQEILDSIDDFLLSELGISLPPKATSDLQSRIFFVKLSEISGTRFDPEYHQHYYTALQTAIHQGKYEVAKIRDIAFINQQLESMEKYDFINYIDLSCVEKENGIIKDTILIDKDFPSRARQRVHKGDLLVSTLSGSMKAIALVSEYKENLIASTGFFVISKVKQNLSKDFLISMLRTDLFQTLLKREASGSIMSSINYDDFLNVKIPLPPLSVQESIAKEISRRKNNALQLQQEAKSILYSAKSKIEQIILG